MDAPVASLLDPPARSVVLANVAWIEGTLLGTLATIIAIVAVAGLGFAMFSGRVDLRRGLTAVAGCFMLFGAPAIAAGLLALVDRGDSAESLMPVALPTPLAIAPLARPQAPTNQPFDPYAGAAVPR